MYSNMQLAGKTSECEPAILFWHEWARVSAACRRLRTPRFHSALRFAARGPAAQGRDFPGFLFTALKGRSSTQASMDAGMNAHSTPSLALSPSGQALPPVEQWNFLSNDDGFLLTKANKKRYNARGWGHGAYDL